MAQNRKGLWIALAAVVVACFLVAAIVAANHSRASDPAGSPAANPAPSAPPGVPSAPPPADVPSLQSGSHGYSLTWDGVERTYRVFMPAGLSGPTPLVVMLHGGGGSGLQAEKSYGWDRLAEREHVIVAYPDALGPAIHAWNVDGADETGTPCCGRSGRDGVDDVGFIIALVKALEAATPIDPSRVYATGMSNGAILSYALACETDAFAAIGPVAGTLLTDCDHPAPTSVLHIHGLLDSSIPFDGSPGAGTATIDGPPIESVIERWRTIDDCGPAVVTDAGIVTKYVSECADDRTVELVTVADGEHGWPGAPLKEGDPDEVKHQPSQAIDSTPTLWEFFAAHPMG
jgi:polyhydroxybutyrate depolymerase